MQGQSMSEEQKLIKERLTLEGRILAGEEWRQLRIRYDFSGKNLTVGLTIQAQKHMSKLIRPLLADLR